MRAMTDEKRKADRRGTRTRRVLKDALVELILEKRYDSITVQNVIDRADVGRSTFYSHYRDKDDLFLSSWEGLLDAVVSHIKWENIAQGRFMPVMELFSHVRDFHDFYEALVRSRKTALIYRSGHIYLSRRIESALTEALAKSAKPAVSVSILANYLAAGMMNLMKWWLDHKMPYTPERMDEIYHELLMPGFRAALA